jgi:hypothetical protein
MNHSAPPKKALPYSFWSVTRIASYLRIWSILLEKREQGSGKAKERGGQGAKKRYPCTKGQRAPILDVLLQIRARENAAELAGS